MIVVKIEMHSAVTRKVKRLCTMLIHNTGGTDKRGNYAVKVGRRGDGVKKTFANPLREGVVLNYPRLSYNIWRLVLRSLKAAFPEEK